MWAEFTQGECLCFRNRHTKAATWYEGRPNLPRVIYLWLALFTATCLEDPENRNNTLLKKMDTKTREMWILVLLSLVRGHDSADSADEHLGKTTKVINNCCAILSTGFHNLRLVFITHYVQKCRPHSAYFMICVTKVRVCSDFCAKSAGDLSISQVFEAHTFSTYLNRKQNT